MQSTERACDMMLPVRWIGLVVRASATPLLAAARALVALTV
jgi:hypothetical protein